MRIGGRQRDRALFFGKKRRSPNSWSTEYLVGVNSGAYPRAKDTTRIGDRVIVPEPTSSDAWEFGGFVARMIGRRDDVNILVEDQDSNVWEVEESRVEIIDENL
jgi:hypothetical protein